MLESPPDRFEVTFKGGFFDGKVVRHDDAEHDDLADPVSIFAATRGGQIGTGFQCYSPEGLKVHRERGPQQGIADGFRARHKYIIRERNVDEDGTVRLVMVYESLDVK